jgi:hypothetical protein
MQAAVTKATTLRLRAIRTVAPCQGCHAESALVPAVLRVREERTSEGGGRGKERGRQRIRVLQADGKRESGRELERERRWKGVRRGEGEIMGGQAEMQGCRTGALTPTNIWP